jgi:Fibronectin type III domain
MRRLRIGKRSSRVGVATASVLCMTAAVIAISKPASAGSSTVTFSASVTLPAQPSSNFAGAGGGGDGWGVALSSTKLYNVFHHLTTLNVECHLQSDASVCAGYPKTVTDGSGHNFATSIAPGMYLHQANGKLYVPVVRTSDYTGGIACIDTKSSSSNPFCGFTALTPTGDSPIDSTAGLSDPIQIGTNWYVFNEVSGSSPSGAEDKMLCFSLKTFKACSGQPYAYNYGAFALSAIGYSWPMGFAGTKLYTQLVGSTDKLGCFDTVTHKACTGSWPVTVDGASEAPFPKLNASGKPVGVCLHITNTPCYTPTGAPSSTPAALPAAIGPGYQYDGQAVVIGSRVYVTSNIDDAVDCFDFSTNQSCPNFPHTFSNLGLLYTVNRDPYRSSCIWVNSDNGSEQIQNFDAFSAGTCADSPYRVFAAAIVASPHLCIPAKYTSLSVVAPSYKNYTSGTVDFQNSNGVPIAGVSTHHLVKGKTSLTDLHLSTNNKLPQFLITLTGASASLKSITVKVVWTGKYSPKCVAGAAKVLGAGPPSPPIDVGGHVVSRSGHVTWKRPLHDGHSPITGYVVTGYDAAGHAVGSCKSIAPTLTCDIKSKSPFQLSTIYTFKVVAVNAVGRSSPGVGYSVPAAATSPIVTTKVQVTG